MSKEDSKMYVMAFELATMINEYFGKEKAKIPDIIAAMQMASNIIFVGASKHLKKEDQEGKEIIEKFIYRSKEEIKQMLDGKIAPWM